MLTARIWLTSSIIACGEMRRCRVRRCTAVQFLESPVWVQVLNTANLCQVSRIGVNLPTYCYSPLYFDNSTLAVALVGSKSLLCFSSRSSIIFPDSGQPILQLKPCLICSPFKSRPSQCCAAWFWILSLAWLSRCDCWLLRYSKCGVHQMKDLAHARIADSYLKTPIKIFCRIS